MKSQLIKAGIVVRIDPNDHKRNSVRPRVTASGQLPGVAARQGVTLGRPGKPFAAFFLPSGPQLADAVPMRRAQTES
jgi:hypothetical protein